MNLIGAGVDRVDGPAKVTGKATYIGDVQLPRMTYAALVLSTIANGRIVSLDTAQATRMPGVLLVMSHTNAPALPDAGRAGIDPPSGRVLCLLQDERVHFDRQPIAVVVAETFEQATAAAARVKAHYAPEPPILDFAAARTQAHSPGKINGEAADSSREGPSPGPVAQRVSAVYTTPIENHNPMEPHATVAAWNGASLTLHDTTQGISGEQKTIAKIFGLDPQNVHVICPYVGGGFGCKGSVWSHVPLTAMAARLVDRPVKLVLERTQMFGPVGARPRTEQHLNVAATAQGDFAELHHDVFSHTSRIEDFAEPAAMQTRLLYACPTVTTSHRVVPLNLGTPTFQRAPGHSTGTYGLGCALDELSIALSLDPIEMRRRNEAAQDPDTGRPWSSRSLTQCYTAAAAAFGWARRTPQPRSMQDGRRLVGWGYATATYPAKRSAAKARARISADGMVVVGSGTQDLGTGTYTVMTQIAAQTLGFPLARVRFELGDSSLPPAPVSGGSQSVASVAPAVQSAARGLRDQLIALAVRDEASPVYRASVADVVIEDGAVGLRSGGRREPLTAVMLRNGAESLSADAAAESGPEAKKYSMHSFGAVFAEVQIDPELGTVRVPRVVARYGIGKLINAKTGRSQLLGGVVWGIGMALMEETLVDPTVGRVVNANLAEYHVPTNADIGAIDVDVVHEEDPYIDALGAKGIGEIGITGVAAAIVNAAYHATGIRVRDLPLTLDKLLGAAPVSRA
jgi:xanthine dehydrogenase YagR molybdenum-binding subunit